MNFSSADSPVCVTVRADASPSIGYGHIRRTLAVVECLQSQGTLRARYAVQDGCDTSLLKTTNCEIKYLSSRDIQSIQACHQPKEGPLLVDIPELTYEQLRWLHQAGYCTVVFDDSRELASYPVNLVVNYAPSAPRLPYRGLPATRFCLGPDYFPLRDEFLARSEPAHITEPVRHVVITFGGSDPQDQTTKLVKLFSEQDHSWKVTAILGPGYMGQAHQVARTSAVQLRQNVINMAELLATADLAISGAGGTALELAFMGVPTILMVLTQDQLSIASALAEDGAAVNLGWYDDISNQQIWHFVQQLVNDAERRAALSAAGRRLVDGRGAQRLALIISELWQRHSLATKHAPRAGEEKST